MERLLGLVQPQAAEYPVGVEKFDPFSTTAVVTYVRRIVTPKALRATIIVLSGSLATSVLLLHAMRSDIKQLQANATESKQSMADMQKHLDVLHDINTQLAVMKADLHNVATEVEHQRQRWERIEEEADRPPHATRKRRER